jgi:hypothetical protein
VIRAGFARGVFMAVYCVAYVAALRLDLPLFRYYPLTRSFSWPQQHLANQGPAMVWYGLMATAAICAAAVASIIDDRLLDRVRMYLWLFPCLAMVAVAYLLRPLFA